MPTHVSLPPARTRLPAATALVAAAALALGGAVLLAPGGASAATSVLGHDPLGHISSVKAKTVTSPMTGMPTTTLTLHGWAADPDRRTSNATVALVLDGKSTLGTATTSLSYKSATKKYQLGATPGFSVSGVVPDGKHVVCLVARNVKAGLDSIRKCVATPLGRTLTSAQFAKHSPTGKITSSWANKKSVHYRGYAQDRDLRNRPVRVVLYLDGRAVRTVDTAAYAKRPADAGPNSRFDILVPVDVVGTHVGCLWAVDIGVGTNTKLGCQAVDNRAPKNAAVPYTAAPTVNGKFMKLALKQRGKPYVWGATGPKSFDCSGLTGWVMKKNGYSIPRVSQDQIKAARLIPADHARPGDLVFLHDDQGDVYHVGFYVSPGKMFAAIQPGDGVNYQNIWDPSGVTYGSFTHT